MPDERIATTETALPAAATEAARPDRGPKPPAESPQPAELQPANYRNVAVDLRYPEATK
jgi:hypothetical protein